MEVSSDSRLKDIFSNFIRAWVDESNQPKYRVQLGSIIQKNSNSLVVDYSDLTRWDSNLAAMSTKDPMKYLDLFSKSAFEFLREEDPDYAKKVEKYFIVRLRNLPERYPLRKLDVSLLSNIVAITGIVIRVSEVKPYLIEAAWICPNNHSNMVPQKERILRKPVKCKECDETEYFKLDELKCTYINYQILRVQELPEELPPGQLPRQLDIRLYGDIVDTARPGDRVVVTGILKAEEEYGFRGSRLRTFNALLEGNHVEVLGKAPEDVVIEKADEMKFRELARRPDWIKMLVSSFSPSIFGNELLKEAILLLIVGAPQITLPDGTALRGDINILLIGDPGTAKSELLKYSARLAPRGLYTSGKGTTAAGLTAAVVREKSGMLMLEAGAVVLADQGICAIDEFDKMGSTDRQALHEAMEQQSYHPKTEIMFSNGEKIEVGGLVDELMKFNRGKVIQGKDCEILSLSEVGGFKVLTTDFRNIYPTTIHRISRHKSPSHFIRITYTNGKSITVTPEHPIYVFRNGEIKDIRADSVKMGMFAPAPTNYPITNNEVVLTKVSMHSFKKAVTLPDRLDEKLSRLLGYVVSEGHSYLSKKNHTAEVMIASTDKEIINDILQIVRSTFKIEPYLQCKPTSSRKNATKDLLMVRCISLSLYNFFEANFPELLKKSSEKRIPKSIFHTSKENKIHFLLGAFRGDGFLDSERFGYTTNSTNLARDYCDLLLSLGIYSYITKSSTYFSKRDEAFKTAYKVVVSGKESMAIFYELIGKYDQRKDRINHFVLRSKNILNDQDTIPTEVASEIKKLLKEYRLDNGYFFNHVKSKWAVNRKVAIEHLKRIEKQIPSLNEVSQMNDAREVRKRCRISLNQIASQIKRSTSMVTYMERNHSAKNYSLLLASIKQLAKEKIENTRSSITKLNSLVNSEIRFVRIKEVKVLNNEDVDWVYDVTVEPNHTFISEGLVLHNTVSVAKGGIVVTLNARTSILSAANPLLGKYDPYKNLAENINLPSPLLTRFDLIFVIRDVPERVVDEQIASHIMAIRRSRSFVQKPPLDIEFLRKYLLYCKNISPIITPEAEKMIIDFYLEMRTQTESQAVPVTPRQLESLIRLAMARARILLRNEVSKEDVAEAITLTKNMLYTVAVDKKTGKIDMGTITGVPASERSKLEIVFQKYKELAGPTNEPVELNGLIKVIVETGKFNEVEAKIYFSQLEQKGVFYMTKPGYYRRA